MGFIEQYTQGKVQIPSRDFSIGQTIKNIPKSAGRYVSDIGTAIKGVFDPRPEKNLFNQIAAPIAGAVEKLIPGRQSNEESLEAIGTFFKNRYGNEDALKQTIQNDPVGFVADLSTVLTGGGALISKAGQVGKLSALSKAGQIVQKTGLAIEPLTLAGKGAFISTYPIRKLGGALVRESLGVTTGVGGNVIKEAFRNPTPEFTAALRGRTTVENVLTTAREGLHELKDARAATYRTQLQAIKTGQKEIAVNFRNFIDSKLREFNIKRTKNGLDFSKSTIADTTEQSRIGDVIDSVLQWDDNSATGLDTLKQRLDDFYTPSGKGRALTNSIRDNVYTTLKKAVPEYGTMTKGYAEASQLIKEIEDTLSLKEGARVDTTIRKLTSVLKQNNEFRQTLIEKLDNLTSPNITSELAGAALRPGIPSGLIGRSIFAGGLTGGAAGLVGLAAVSPNILFGLAFTWPRIVGEMLRVLGLSNKAIESFMKFIQSPVGKKILQGAFQTGRVNKDRE